MIDWTASMQQTFKYYNVDEATWCDSSEINTITSCSISRDMEKDTLGSASIECTGQLNESYIRIYLEAIQNGTTYKFPLGTFLTQTVPTNFNGKVNKVSIEAYTPLIELAEKMPPIGYTISKDTEAMEIISTLCDENLRAPVVITKSSDILGVNYTADIQDTWLTYLRSALTSLDYEFMLDEMGRVIFNKPQNISGVNPVWTYSDDNSSILIPEISVNRDLYGIPNTVEVVYGGQYAKVVNDDENSPTSTINRGRTILLRITDPNIIGAVTQETVLKYAKNALQKASSLEYTITYSHGYCPVRLGDIVRLNYSRAGLNNITAKVTSQSIECRPGCLVTETATFTTGLWG